MSDAKGTAKATSFTELYGNHARAVYQFALYLSGDPALAEDIVSETFLRIWDSATVLRMETVQGYLFTIARNLFLHDLRRKGKQDPLEDTHSVAEVAVREVVSKEALRDTLAALQTLPETDRAALLLRAQEGVSYEEIARILGLSLSSVKVKIHRARLFLAERRKGVVHARSSSD
jgi:RNA polymerase sigma-70 factor, ECF subfamily